MDSRSFSVCWHWDAFFKGFVCWYRPNLLQLMIKTMTPGWPLRPKRSAQYLYRRPRNAGDKVPKSKVTAAKFDALSKSLVVGGEGEGQALYLLTRVNRFKFEVCCTDRIWTADLAIWHSLCLAMGKDERWTLWDYCWIFLFISSGILLCKDEDQYGGGGVKPKLTA